MRNDAAFARHRAADPHCTCNDCLSHFAAAADAALEAERATVSAIILLRMRVDSRRPEPSDADVCLLNAARHLAGQLQ